MSETKQESKKLVTTEKEYRAKVFFKMNALNLKECLKLQGTLTNEVKIVFDALKVTWQSVDPAHVCMMRQEHLNKGIEAYSFSSSEQSIVLGIDIEKLLNILKTVKKNDVVTFDYDADKEYQKIFITVRGIVYTVGTIDPEGMLENKMPVLELPACFIIGTELFYEFIKQAGNVSDHFSITTDKEKLTLFAEGDTDKMNMVLEHGKLELLSSPGTFRSLYSIDYMSNVITGLKKLFDRVEIRIANDNVVQLKCFDSNGVTVTVLLAPRIESE
jgi:hypothetical protein